MKIGSFVFRYKFNPFERRIPSITPLSSSIAHAYREREEQPSLADFLAIDFKEARKFYLNFLRNCIISKLRKTERESILNDRDNHYIQIRERTAKRIKDVVRCSKIDDKIWMRYLKWYEENKKHSYLELDGNTIFITRDGYFELYMELKGL